MTPYLVGRLLFRADATVADWVADQVMGPGSTRFRDPAAIGVLGPDGALAGGVVFVARRGDDLEVSGAAAKGFRLLPADLRLILRTALGDAGTGAGAGRLSMSIARSNAPARAFAARLGFRVEGVRRSPAGRRHDTILYGLLGSECRFLERPHHGHA